MELRRWPHFRESRLCYLMVQVTEITERPTRDPHARGTRVHYRAGSRERCPNSTATHDDRSRCSRGRGNQWSYVDR